MHTTRRDIQSVKHAFMGSVYMETGYTAASVALSPSIDVRGDD
jgi:hypothetical protein